MLIEVFMAPNCTKCGKAVTVIESVLATMNTKLIELRKINIVEEIDYAVSIGLRATPGIAINGKLFFSSTPSESALREIILKINKEESHV